MRRFSCAAALAAIGLVALPSSVGGAYCHGGPSPSALQNTYPINTTEPQFVRAVANGRAYTMGAQGFDFNVLHLYGTAYEMGFAHGALFPEEVKNMSQAVWSYMVEQVQENIAFLPTWLADMIGNLGLDVALDVLIDTTRPYTGSYIYDELKGLSEGSGADHKTLQRIHLIGELTQGDCSMIGAWGKATAGGKTLQLRALDWDTDGPFKHFPAVVIYHPNDPATPTANAWANVGFLGWIGTLSGMSSAQMAVSEIGVSFPDTTWFGSESFVGTPFVYALRDILEFDKSYNDSIARLSSINRTCDLILGVGDGKPNAQTFRGFAYSGSALHTFDDTNMQPWNATNTWHPRMDSVVYWGMDWLCPGYTIPLSHQIEYAYGALTPEIIISNITSLVQTGDVHAAVYDLTDGLLFVSFMNRSPNDPLNLPQNAYDRQWSRLNLTALFALPPPAVEATLA